MAAPRPSASLSGILQAANETCSALEKHSNDCSLFEKVWAEVEEKLSAYGLQQPLVPRIRKIPRKFEGVLNEGQEFQSLKVYQDSYMKACDEIRQRFNQNGIQNYLKIEPIVLNSNVRTTVDDLALQALFKKYEISEKRLRVNLTLQALGQDFNNIKSVVLYLQVLKAETKLLHSELFKLLKLLLLFPVSSCTAERGFSVLQFVKSYLRSTMGQERLNHCCLLHAYPNEVEMIDIDAIMCQFINNKTRVRTFGKL